MSKGGTPPQPSKALCRQIDGKKRAVMAEHVYNNQASTQQDLENMTIFISQSNSQ